MQISFLALAAAVATPSDATKSVAIAAALSLAQKVEAEMFRAASVAAGVASGSRGLSVRRRVKAHKEDDGDKAAKKGADVGIFNQTPCPTTCPDDSYALYCNGESNNACDGRQCCYGNDGPDSSSCQEFTGCVKRDGSCTGKKACKSASVAKITNSCQGDYACAEATIGETTNSCKAYAACWWASADSIKDSCEPLASVGDFQGDDNYQCAYLGYDGGTVGDITNSCKGGTKACKWLGSYDGIVGNVTNSCEAKGACTWLGCGRDSEAPVGIGDVADSCNGDYACYDMATYGTVASVNNGCNANSGCYYLAASSHQLLSSVGPIVSSCNGGDESCSKLAHNGGDVKGISWSCNSKTDTPCTNLAINGTSIGFVKNKRGVEKIRRHSKDQAETIEDCLLKCNDNKHGCTSIQWRPKITWSCGLFKGDLTVQCGWNNICVKV